MPTATVPAEETREMRLFSALLIATDQDPLAVFLAKRRLPGPTWRTWEQITIDMHAATGETVTREGLRRWAIRYGIPDDSSRTPTPDELRYYKSRLRRAHISID